MHCRCTDEGEENVLSAEVLRWQATCLPAGREAEVFEDFSDRLAVLNEAYHRERSLTVRTEQGVCLVDFLDQTRPNFLACAQGDLRLQDRGDGLDLPCLTACAPHTV